MVMDKHLKARMGDDLKFEKTKEEDEHKGDGYKCCGSSAVAEGVRTKIMVDIDLFQRRMSNSYCTGLRIYLSAVLVACRQNGWKSYSNLILIYSDFL